MKAHYKITRKRHYKGKRRPDNFYQMKINLISDKDLIFSGVYDYANANQISISEACLRLIKKGLGL
jgi:ribosomal protein L4